MIYAIAIDPDAPERDERAVSEWLARHVERALAPLPRLWIADGALAAEQIFNALAPLLAADTCLMIIKAATEAIWRGLEAGDARWLADHFPGSITERIPDAAQGRTR
jgi:hypothetical protein